MKRHQSSMSGFTLLELVSVLVLLAVLAVSVAPRMFDTSDLSLLQQRDRLLSQLRTLQTQSMQDSAGLLTRCPTLVVKATVAAPATLQACQSHADFIADASDERQLHFDSNLQLSTDFATLPLQLRFNQWGQPRGSCDGSAAICRIELRMAGQSAAVCLHAQGYIQPC